MSLRPKPASDTEGANFRAELARCVAKAHEWNRQSSQQTATHHSRGYDSGSDSMSSDEEMEEEEETEAERVRYRIENILDNMKEGNQLGWPTFESLDAHENYILKLIVDYLDNMSDESVEHEMFENTRPAFWQLARTRGLFKVEGWLKTREFELNEKYGD